MRAATGSGTSREQDRSGERDFEPDPVIEVYKRDVDRSILRENLRRSPAERIAILQAMVDFAEELRRGAKNRV